MAVLYGRAGRAGRLTAQNGGCRPGQVELMQPTLVPAEGSAPEDGRMVPTSKKDPETRRKELLKEVRVMTSTTHQAPL
jgi:hypothetical protein